MSTKVTGIYDARKELGWGKSIIMGLQQCFAMFGATILVPVLTNSYGEGIVGLPLLLPCSALVLLPCGSTSSPRARFPYSWVPPLLSWVCIRLLSPSTAKSMRPAA